MKCVILFRINGGPVRSYSFSCNGDPHEFPNMDAAVAVTLPNEVLGRLVAKGQAVAQIVELDEI